MADRAITGTKLVRLSAVLLSIVVLFSLSGCTPEAKIFASLKNGNVQVAVCEELAAYEIRVKALPQSNRSDYRTVWDAKGESWVHVGDVIVLGKNPEGMSSTSIKAFDVKKDWLNVSIYSKRQGETVIKVAEFRPGSIESGRWTGQASVLPNGVEPCSS